jgi:acyl carrier protein
MDRKSIRAVVLDTLRGIAPEVAADELDDELALRDQVDLDSMDWLNVLIGLHQRCGVDIAEADYAQLTTLNRIVDYLAARMR